MGDRGAREATAATGAAARAGGIGRRVVEAVLPARMGTSFRWLVSSSWISNLGDGIGLAAAPLLIASQTQDPLLVALGALVQRLPWLVFGLYAGVLADRMDRRVLVVAVDLARAGVLLALAVTIVGGRVTVALVLVAMLLAGIAEVFADTATGTLLPMVVAKDDLGIGNARLMSGLLTGNQLVGPAVGAVLFAAGRASPFLTQAVCVALGAVLLSRIRLPAMERPRARSRLRHDVVEGLHWTWGSPAVRTLTLTIVTFNVTYGAAWSVLVLYAHERLGVGAVGFGLLSTAVAVGGVAGTASYDWLERRASLADIMRAGLIIETCTHLALALTTSWSVALAVMVVFGAHAFVWGTTARTVRMRAVPTELQGRVGSVYSIAIFGGILAGQAVGGVIARLGGVTAPFWFAFAGSAVLLALIWRELGHIAHADAA
jgi:predicted MFS family arabinose efflux permease